MFNYMKTRCTSFVLETHLQIERDRTNEVLWCSADEEPVAFEMAVFVCLRREKMLGSLLVPVLATGASK